MRDEFANGTPAEEITWMVVVSDKITSISFYCHGLTKMISARGGENQLGFAYNIKSVDSSKVNFLQSDIDKLDTNAFANTRTMFYSCNAGTKEYIIKGESFAQEWVNKTGGQATGIVNGRTSYANINSYVSGFGGTRGFQLDIFSKILSMVGFNSSKQIIKEDRENNGKGYSEYGSLYNPVMISPDLVNHFGEGHGISEMLLRNLIQFDYSWINGHWKDFYPEECE